jgi:hypothetical protein
MSDYEELNARLNHLQRQNRLLGGAVALCLVLAMLGWLAERVPVRAEKEVPRPPEEVQSSVRARQLVVLDGKDQRRIVLGVDETWPRDMEAKAKQDEPGVYLRDARGQPRLALFGHAAGGKVVLLDDRGKPALLLAVGKDRQTLVGFNDPKGTTRGLFGIDGTGKPLLILRGNGALVGINDNTGTTRALLGTSKEGEGVVVIQDQTGKAVAQMP